MKTIIKQSDLRSDKKSAAFFEANPRIAKTLDSGERRSFRDALKKVGRDVNRKKLGEVLWDFRYGDKKGKMSKNDTRIIAQEIGGGSRIIRKPRGLNYQAPRFISQRMSSNIQNNNLSHDSNLSSVGVHSNLQSRPGSRINLVN